MEWPDWWTWDIEISSHCAKRMRGRLFTEADLRAILEDAVELVEQTHGTFLVRSRYENRDWEVYLDPDVEAKLIVVRSACAIS